MHNLVSFFHLIIFGLLSYIFGLNFFQFGTMYVVTAICLIAYAETFHKEQNEKN